LTQPDAGIDPVLSVLITEIQVVREFKSTLQAEQKSLVDGDVNALTQLSKPKLDLVERLNKLAEERLRKLELQGFSPDRSGMELWAAGMGSVAKDAWQSMLAIASEAKQSNKINGNLIQSRLQNNQQALSVLMSAADQASLYGPDGQRHGALQGGGKLHSGIIGKA
jgi:flagella synthesis protein FlgN